MLTAQAFDSIQHIDRATWNDCFADTLENWDYYLAVEKAGVAGFQWRYLAVFDGKTLLAVAPAFITHYNLTTMQGAGKRLTDALNRVWPNALSLSLYAIGSPVTERCNVGTASHLTEQQRDQALTRLLQMARSDADHFKIGLMAVKDAPTTDSAWTAACRAQNLQAIPSLPSATLSIQFGSIDSYLGSLGKSTRKDLRRTLRGPAPRIEWRREVKDVLPEMMRLYEATLARSDLQFERLDEAYFISVLEQLGDRSACVLYWIDDQLVAFNLMLLDDQRLIDKFFAHDVDRTRDHNLYARSWLENVDFCIRNGIPVYEAGQAGYASKTRFGCQFHGNMMFFRHRNWLLNSLLKLAKLIIRPDRYDPAMAAAIGENR